MAKRTKISRREISLVKGFTKHTKLNDQDILAFFTHPSRSINHRLIGHIRNGVRFPEVGVCSAGELSTFRENWPRSRDELLPTDEAIRRAHRAKSLMVAAVKSFNSSDQIHRAELFLVTAMIAWTYLALAIMQKRGKKIQKTNNQGEAIHTKHGAEIVKSLSECLDTNELNIAEEVKTNLRYLLEIRHEIEHRGNIGRIDLTIGPYLQSCCINFEQTIRKEFGSDAGAQSELNVA